MMYNHMALTHSVFEKEDVARHSSGPPAYSTVHTLAKVRKVPTVQPGVISTETRARAGGVFGLVGRVSTQARQDKGSVAPSRRVLNPYFSRTLFLAVGRLPPESWAPR